MESMIATRICAVTKLFEELTEKNKFMIIESTTTTVVK